MTKYKRLNAIFHRVKKNFYFRAEIGSIDEWKVPPIGYDGSQRITGDCVEFCLAVRYLLDQEPTPSRLVGCFTEKKVPHLVVEVSGWIFDNRQDGVKANLQLRRYQWLAISGYQRGDPWRAITRIKPPSQASEFS